MKSEAIKTVIKKYPIICGCGVVALVLMGVLYFRATLLSEHKAVLENLSAENERYRQNVDNASQLQSQLDFIIDANRAIAERSLTVEGFQNLQYFFRLESEVGIKYTDLRPGGGKAPPKGRTYVPLNYIVGIQGSFNQAITFLRHLEQGMYFCRVTSASISSSGSTVTLNLNIDLLGTQ